MHIYFVGGEESDFQGVALTDFAADWSPAYFRDEYARLGVRARTPTGATALFSIPTTWLWAGWRWYTTSHPYNSFSISSGGQDLFKVNASGGVFRWNGSAWVQLGSCFPALRSGELTKMDVHLSYTNPGTLTIHQGGQQVFTYDGDMVLPGHLQVDSAHFEGNGDMYFSEVVVADVDTRQLSVATLAPMGPGSVNEWSGGHSDISEHFLDDRTVISSDWPDKTATFQLENYTLASGEAVVAVTASARAMVQGTPQHYISLGLYLGSGVYESDWKMPGASPTGGLQYTWFQNPSTGVGWTQADLDALQLAFRSHQ